MVSKFSIGLLFCLLTASFQLQAAISSQIDKNVIEQGETFLLLLNVTKSDIDKLDLTPLEKDFELIGRSHQSSTTILNGEVQSSTRLLLTLAPKRAGALTVPALTLDAEQSQVHTIEVKEVKQLSAVDGGVEMLSTLSEDSPYVQQPLIYQMNLVLGQRIFNASFQEPTITQGKALLKPLGEQRQYRQTLNGRDMLVVEQSWLVTPQQSGVLEIEGAKLSAEVTSRNAQPNTYRRLNDPRSTRRIFVSADNYQLNVLPIPAEYKGDNWLAASELNLTSQLDSDQWRQGEPVTRTITLKAIGVTEDQLPKLVLPNVEGLKQYAAKPIFKQEYIDDQLVSEMKIEVTLIPSRSGSLRLPAIELFWWNTVTNSQQRSVLEEQLLDVAASTLAEPTQKQSAVPTFEQAPISEEVMTDQAAIQPALGTDLKLQDENKGWNGFSLWVILLSGTGGMLLGGLLTFVYFKRKGRQVTNNKNRSKEMTASPSMRAIKEACRNNDAKTARHALLAWVRHIEPQATSLDSSKVIFSDALSEAILDLNQCCYAVGKVDWQGDRLWKAVSDEKIVPASKIKGDSRLQELTL